MSLSKKSFITGIGSGLGKALVSEAIERGYEVYALSRRLPEELRGKVNFVRCDLEELENVKTAVYSLLGNLNRIDIVILNAGILGKFGDMRDVSLQEMNRVMNVNLWANKLILDSLMELGVEINQIVGISSGAAVNCNRGWNAYSISKASFNCLLKLYSREMDKTHITALAPGLVLTPMLEEVMAQDDTLYTSIKRIRESSKRTPEEAARLLFDIFPKLLSFESGSFLDVRKISV